MAAGRSSGGMKSRCTDAVSDACLTVSVPGRDSSVSTLRVTRVAPASLRAGPIIAAIRCAVARSSKPQSPSAGAPVAGRTESSSHPGSAAASPTADRSAAGSRSGRGAHATSSIATSAVLIEPRPRRRASVQWVMGPRRRWSVEVTGENCEGAVAALSPHPLPRGNGAPLTELRFPQSPGTVGSAHTFPLGT